MCFQVVIILIGMHSKIEMTPSAIQCDIFSRVWLKVHLPPMLRSFSRYLCLSLVAGTHVIVLIWHLNYASTVFFIFLWIYLSNTCKLHCLPLNFKALYSLLKGRQPHRKGKGQRTEIYSMSLWRIPFISPSLRNATTGGGTGDGLEYFPL